MSADKLAQALTFIVSVVMTRQDERVIKTQNKLYRIEAVSSDEAIGKAITLAQADFPEHQFHTSCYWELAAHQAQQARPVASIYISVDGSREFDDWKHPLPVGRNELYASPQPAHVQGWQPIETAPEDLDRPAVVFWRNADGEEQSCFDYTEDGCWMEWHNHAEHVEIIGGHGVSYTPPYTHWMPLPPAPQHGDKT